LNQDFAQVQFRTWGKLGCPVTVDKEVVLNNAL